MPKSEQKNERIKAESKEKIISAAIKVFAKKGYAATNTSDIAEAANISTGLMYRYFRSKQELFETITSFAVEGLAGVTKILDGNGNPREIFDSICQEFLTEMENEEYININVIMIQGIISDNPISQEIIKHDKNMFKAAENLIKRGQKEGLFSLGDPASKSALFFSSIQGLTMMKFLFKESFRLPSLTEMTAFLYEVKNGNNN